MDVNWSHLESSDRIVWKNVKYLYLIFYAPIPWTPLAQWHLRPFANERSRVRFWLRLWSFLFSCRRQGSKQGKKIAYGGDRTCDSKIRGTIDHIIRLWPLHYTCWCHISLLKCYTANILIYAIRRINFENLKFKNHVLIPWEQISMNCFHDSLKYIERNKALFKTIILCVATHKLQFHQ